MTWSVLCSKMASMETPSCKPDVDTRPAYLTLSQVRQLMNALKTHDNASCAAAVVLMLWGGVNFNELKQWRWRDVLETTPLSQAVCLPEPARQWMKRTGYLGVPDAAILPHGWRRRWARLKQQLGIPHAELFKETHRQWAGEDAFLHILAD